MKDKIAEQTSLVSIIVPIFNSELFLARALNSVLEQTYQNFECILINDGSTDGSSKICQSYASKDRRFIFIDNDKNSGVAAVRNQGLEQVEGDFIFWLDSDDYLEPHCIERVLLAFRSKNPDIVIFDVIVDGRTGCFRHVLGGKSRFLTLPEINRGLAEDTVLTSWLHNKPARVDVYKDIQFNPNHIVLEDYAVIPKIFSSKKRIFYLNEPLYHYTVNDTSLVNSFNPKKELQQLSIRLVRTLSFKDNDFLFWRARRSLLRATLFSFIRASQSSRSGKTNQNDLMNFQCSLKDLIKKMPLTSLPNDNLIDVLLIKLVAGFHLRITGILYSIFYPIRKIIKKIIV